MKTKAGKKTKPKLYSHIASAIIPTASIVAVPAIAHLFPQQKYRANEEWGPLASTLLRASLTNQMLIPSSPIPSTHQRDYYHQHSTTTSMGRMEPSSDEDDSDYANRHRKPREPVYATVVKSGTSRSVLLTDPEKRLLGHTVDDEESSTGTPGAGGSSTVHLDPKQALVAELSRSTTTDDKSLKKATVTVTRQQVSPLVLNPVPSQSGPSSARAASAASGVEGIGGEAKSVTSVTARSSLNDTTVPVSARSVSFKEPIVYETFDPSSSHSHPTTTILAANPDSILDRIVLPPPQEYQQNFNELERRNGLLNDEIQQLRLNNNLYQQQNEDLLGRLQSSQKLSQRELNDLLKQAGRDQTKGLEDLNKTLQNRCDQLQSELIGMRERFAQSQSQANLRELKNENHFLKDYIHRLNSASSEYQAMHPPKTLKKEIEKEQRKMQGLPLKGPSPIWLLNQKFLAPLFVCYDEKLHERQEFIKKLQAQLTELHDQVKLITQENISLHDRLVRASASSMVLHEASGGAAHLTDVEHIKRQAYLVLEENKVLQEQLALQTNRLTDVQKTQIHEVSNLTRRLMIVESEKSEADRILETIRMRNEDLRKKYEQLMIDNDHRIHVEEHVREIGEMKRLTDELSEKHASEMQILLRRVQDAESTKKISQLKLTESRGDFERMKGEIKAVKKLNRKLQLRVQTFEKKVELEHIKEQRLTTILDKANEEIEQNKLERDTYLALARTKEDELKKGQARMLDEAVKLAQLEERLESYKSKSKERVNEVQEQMKKQYENLKLRCLEHEQRIQQLLSLLNEKQVLIDDLNSEKRNLEVDLETIWQTTNADNMRMREQLLEMRVAS